MVIKANVVIRVANTAIINITVITTIIAIIINCSIITNIYSKAIKADVKPLWPTQLCEHYSPDITVITTVIISLTYLSKKSKWSNNILG